MLAELQDKRGRLVAQAREALDEIRANTDESRTAELEKRHDDIMAEFDKVDADIQREQKVAAMEARFAAASEAEERAKREGRRPLANGEGRSDEPDGEAPDPSEEYRQAFFGLFQAGGDPSALSVEQRTILRGGVVRDGALEKRIQSTSGTAGGYTVPTTLANMIVKSMAAWGPMYDDAICTVLRTSGGEAITIPTVDDTATAVVKHTEGTALTDDGGSDVTLGQKTLNAYVYDTEFVKWSMELNQDSIFSFEQLLADLLGERLGRRANTELTTGDGTGDPNGIVTASSKAIDAVATNAITSNELIDTLHAVDPAYRMSPKVRWMFNDTTLAAIRKLKDGSGAYMWQMGDIRAGEPATLLGHAYSVNQAMPAMTTGLKPIVFGDFGKYFVRKVGDPMIGVLRERFWPDLGIAGLIRLDGELADTAAVKHVLMA